MSEQSLDQVIDIKLLDWQAADGLTHRENGAEIVQQPYDARVTIGSGRVDFILPIGGETPLQVWLEIEDGKLKVHAYDSVNDEPVNLIVSTSGIVVDTSDRDLGSAPTAR